MSANQASAGGDSQRSADRCGEVSYAAGAKPRLKKGGWVFDPQNCVWYRVLEKNNETATSVDLILDRRAEKWIRNLIVPEGVVSVFPLKSRVDQNRLDSAR